MKRLFEGIALGIVNEAINSASEESQSEDEIQWNSDSSKKSDYQKPEYDDKIAELQVKLKKLGYYHKHIDGLRGPATTKALNDWEHEYGEVDGALTEDEAYLLDQQYKGTDIADDNVDRLSDTADDKYLYETLYALESARAAYHSCKEFQDSDNFFSSGVHNDLQDNFNELEDIAYKQVYAHADCKNIDMKQVNNTRERAEKNYSESDEAQMHKINTRVMIADQDDAHGFMKACNLLSQTLVAMSEKYGQQTMNTKSCKFE